MWVIESYLSKGPPTHAVDIHDADDYRSSIKHVGVIYCGRHVIDGGASMRRVWTQYRCVATRVRGQHGVLDA